MSEPVAVTVEANPRLPLAAKAAFGVGDFGLNVVYQGAGFFLLFVYTDVFGVRPSVAGAIYALAMVWDAIIDPLVGVLADRTRTRWGRYRPWILLGAAPLGLSYAAAYWNPGLAGAALVSWLALTHCVLRTAFAVASIPYSSLQARLSGDARERTSLAGFRMIGAACGGLAVATITPVLVARLATADSATGFLYAGGAAGVLVLAALLYVAIALREPVDAAAARVAPPFWSDLLAFFDQLRKNAPLAQAFGILILGSIALSMFSKLILYYFKYVLHAPAGTETLALVAVPVAMIVLVPLWVVLANRTSKRAAWMIGSCVSALGLAALYLNPTHDLKVVYPIIAVIAAGLSSVGVLAWAILPDTVEWGEAKLGVRHEAKVFGFSAFAQKSALGFNAFLIGFALEATGYIANAPQTPRASQAIAAMISLAPLACIVATAAIMAFYPIDAKRHAALQAEIAARRSAQV
ncbi:MAG: glycoside-pentoside-hexuronide (GPH):cation symporter [Terricaulis sp.]